MQVPWRGKKEIWREMVVFIGSAKKLLALGACVEDGCEVWVSS